MECLPPFLCRKKRRCKYCFTPLKNNLDAFCNQNCQIFYLYNDSFSSCDSFYHKYLLNLET